MFVPFLSSMSPYFLWDHPLFSPIVTVIFICIRLYRNHKITLYRKTIPLIIVAFILSFVIEFIHFDEIAIGDFFSFVFKRFFFLVIVLTLSIQEAVGLLKLITKYFSIILFVSMLFWIVHLLGTKLPYSIIRFQDSVTYPEFYNYYFFIKADYLTFFPRFQSIFLEPGHLGMICAFLLFANQYDLKDKYVLCIFCALLLSFSLAAYVLLGCGWFLFYLKCEKRNIIYIFLLLSMISVLCSYAWEKEDNVVNEYILSRLVYEDGKLSGDNRTSEDFDDYFSKKIMTSSDCLIGIGPKTFQTKLSFSGSGNSSYKVFIVMDGIVGLLIVLFFYSGILLKYYTRELFLLFILYVISFIQRPYALWDSQILIYILSAFIFSNERKYKLLN